MQATSGSIGRGAAFVLVSLLAGAAHGEEEPGAARGIRLVPGGAAGETVVVLRPAEVPDESDDRRCRQLAAALEAFDAANGEAPGSLRDVTFAWASEGKKRRADKLSVVVRFHEAVDCKGFVYTLFDRPAVAMFQGLTYYTGDGEGSWSAYFVDERTVLLAPERRLKELIFRPVANGPANGDARKQFLSADEAQGLDAYQTRLRHERTMPRPLARLVGVVLTAVLGER